MAPSKIPWLTNPDLFLLTEGGVAKVWRCKRTLTSEATLMTRDDFEHVGDVHNHLDLIQSMIEWPEDDYKELVEYITQRSLLVNSQGLVIAELLLKSSSSGGPDLQGKKINGPLYMWSLHIIALDTYIDQYLVRPIPFRPIQFLDDDKKGPGRGDVPVELSLSEQKLTRELEKEKKAKEEREKEVEKLKEKLKNISIDKEAATDNKQIIELKEMNKTLKSGKEAAEKEATELKEANKTLRSGKEALDKQVKDLQDEIESLTSKPVWMSDLNIPEDNNNMGWVSISALSRVTWYNLTRVGLQGSVTTEDDTTNVRASYFYKFISTYYKDVTWIGVDFQSLPKKEKARFIKDKWSVGYYSEYPYPLKIIS